MLKDSPQIMPKYVTMIHGVNFLIQEEDNQAPFLRGFYVNVFSENNSPSEAEDDAVALVRARPGFRETIKNRPDDPPRLLVEEIAELTDWPENCARPMSGFVFYEADS